MKIPSVSRKNDLGVAGDGARRGSDGIKMNGAIRALIIRPQMQLTSPNRNQHTGNNTKPAKFANKCL